jgi:hypothetical protein
MDPITEYSDSNSVGSSNSTNVLLSTSVSSSQMTDKETVNYILDNWCTYTAPDHVVRLAFEQNYINNMIEWINLTDKDIDEIQVNIPKRSGKNGTDRIGIPAVMKTKIKQVRDFGFHLARKYGMKPPNNAWRDEIPVDDFFLFMEKYIQAHRGIISPSIVSSNPQATVYTPSTQHLNPM